MDVEDGHALVQRLLAPDLKLIAAKGRARRPKRRLAKRRSTGVAKMRRVGAFT